MKKSKVLKRVCLLLILMISVATVFSGCGSGTATESDNSASSTGVAASSSAESSSVQPALEPVNLKYFMIGGNQPDEAEVYEAANKIIKEKINANVEFVVFDWGTYNDKMKVKIAAAEDFDLCFTSSWANDCFSNVAKNSFADVSELLAKYAPNRYAAVPKDLWEKLKINGKLYLLVNGFVAQQNAIWLQKDLLDKYEMDASKMTKLEDLTPFLEAVKKNDPQMIPWAEKKDSNLKFNFEDLEVNILGANLPGAVIKTDATSKLVNEFELPEVMALLKLKHEWYTKGLIRKGAATIGDTVADMKAGKIAAYNFQWFPGMEAEQDAQAPGKHYVASIISDSYLATSNIFADMCAINEGSKNKERAIMLYELLNTNKDVLKLLGAGIEGKHYNKVDENVVDLIPDSGYAPGNNWAWGDMERNGYVLKGAPLDIAAKKIEMTDKAKVSPVMGFAFNTESVKTEVANVQAVWNEMAPLLLTGTVDPEKYLPLFIEKMKKAGLEKIFVEAQKQIDSKK